MTRSFTGSVLALTLVLATASLAEAHEQKFMGVVKSLEGVHLTITTTDEKSVMVMLHEKTRITRGKDTQKPEDIKIGERIVVITTDGPGKDGHAMLMAKEIRLATTPPKR